MNAIDILVLLLIGGCAIFGLMRGFVQETLSLIAQKELVTNRNTGLGSALAVLTFMTVMTVSYLCIRFIGGNIRALTQEDQ